MAKKDKEVIPEEVTASEPVETITSEVTSSELCADCNGTGRHLPELTCPTCEGTGKK